MTEHIELKGPLYRVKEIQILHPPEGQSGVFLRIVSVHLQNNEEKNFDFRYASVEQVIEYLQEVVDVLKERHT